MQGFSIDILRLGNRLFNFFLDCRASLAMTEGMFGIIEGMFEITEVMFEMTEEDVWDEGRECSQ
jgi:hypothetical protein